MGDYINANSIDVEEFNKENAFLQPTQISFEKGNYNEIEYLGDSLIHKVQTIKNTILPLIEKSLVELLGNSDAYKRSNFFSKLEFVESKPVYSVETIYSVPLWIGQDVERSFILDDANYVLNTISVVPNVSWQKCEIDTTEGELRVNFLC